jgi:hypothetical protein
VTVEEGPVTPDSQSLIVHLNGVLSQIRDTFTAEGVLLPTRQYITVGAEGSTAWDCEQLTVSLAQLYTGPPGEQAQAPSRCSDPASAVVIVELIRCVPVPQVNTRSKVGPDVAKMTDATEVLLVDAWLLRRAGQEFADAQNFFGSMADVAFSTPQGGYQAAVMTLVAAVV